jgi:hypothetical protein
MKLAVVATSSLQAVSKANPMAHPKAMARVKNAATKVILKVVTKAIMTK